MEWKTSPDIPLSNIKSMALAEIHIRGEGEELNHSSYKMSMMMMMVIRQPCCKERNEGRVGAAAADDEGERQANLRQLGIAFFCRLSEVGGGGGTKKENQFPIADNDLATTTPRIASSPVLVLIISIRLGEPPSSVVLPHRLSPHLLLSIAAAQKHLQEMATRVAVLAPH